MSKDKKNKKPEETKSEQELTEQDLESTSGGVLIGLNQPGLQQFPKHIAIGKPAMGDGSVFPTDQRNVKL
ncbi:MAG: hypothetical protein HXX08_22235 [Chloroflexi bacterium]|uniref:Uncharacterized protein n=1 Tax=Candidatus Chlorohelix allophototropha TaxID=3003348 RepID=A0A8T7M8U9_9CHLR|nr:hypothetical protein [Chloroflexota bacterium]WJW68517.1 hypothetical protein OZ401_004131 [Chloroflexota bacterium L227-S17]